jgi:hypothetical protein
MMTEERLMVAEAVFNGLIGEEHLTIEEVDEFCLLVAEEAMEQLMDQALERGCSVFSGFEDGDTIH